MQEQYLNKGLEIVKTLNSFTYQAYLVGGVVRDYVMHNDFNDVDIATNATPEQIQQIYPDVNMQYQHLGCVTLKLDEFVFQISTFKEEVYEKPRKPSKVYYAQNLIDDVKRRDFTINALALTDTLKVVDLVNGLKDIKRKKVRVIGKPKLRFKEDPLRILRAYNLVARFKFDIAFRTVIGIRLSNKYLKDLSDSQISKELLKIFDAPHGKKAIAEMLDNNTHKYLKDYKHGLYYVCRYFKKLSLVEKFALCYSINENIPENISLDRVTFGKVKNLIEVINATKDFNKKEKENITYKHIFEYGAEVLFSAVKINYYLRKQYPKLLNKVKKLDKKLPIHSIADLEINGADIVQLNNGQSGSYVKTIIDELASEVVLGLIKNERNELLEKAKLILQTMNTDEVVKQEKTTEVIPEIKETKKPEKVEIDNELLKLKIHYDMQYNELVKTSLASFLKGNESEEEAQAIQEQIEKQVKEALLSQNPEYHVLVQKGLI